MKIQIISDLHFEFRNKQEINLIFNKLKSDAEVIILAGDITCRKSIFEILRLFSDYYNHVIYVSGNHEHYGTHIDKLRQLRDQVQNSLSYVEWLDNNEVTINNQKFIGCTLWFPWNPLNQIYESQMNDFRSILNFREWVYEENKKSTSYLNNNCDKTTIVVTHHLPSYKSVHENYKNSNLNRFFVSELDDLIKEKQPKYWLHGHTHKCFDYNLYNTRIIANPLGYPFENNEADYSKIIEI